MKIYSNKNGYTVYQPLIFALYPTLFLSNYSHTITVQTGSQVITVGLIIIALPVLFMRYVINRKNLKRPVVEIDNHTLRIRNQFGFIGAFPITDIISVVDAGPSIRIEFKPRARMFNYALVSKINIDVEDLYKLLQTIKKN